MSSLPRVAGVDTAVRNYPRLLKRLLRLMDISRNLGLTHDLPELLRQIIDAATELTDTEAASILLIDPRTHELRFEASNSVDTASMEDIVVPREGSIAGWIVSHGEPVVLNDVTQDSRHYQVVDQQMDFTTRSLLGVPLTTREKTIGVLEALNKRDAGLFTQDDVEVLQTLAAQAAVAIESARLFQQSDLIAEMVHELRTPLAALSATVHLLQRPDVPEAKRAELVSTIQRETNRLTTMTSDFLDLARLESGRARFHRQPFDVVELIGECIGVVEPQASAQRVSLQTDLPAKAVIIEADRAKIKQVLLNLLTNGIKYNRENGAVSVRASAQGARLSVSVADTGRGISPDALPHIFEKFYRVPDSEGWTQGTGLGLAIARRIVEVHGGDMQVESSLGVGATFTFRLPLPGPVRQ